MNLQWGIGVFKVSMALVLAVGFLEVFERFMGLEWYV